MFELSLYGPYCSVPGVCSYNNGFTDGYVIGLVSTITIIVFIEALVTIIQSYKGNQENDNNKIE